jgi:hypothetical protein
MAATCFRLYLSEVTYSVEAEVPCRAYKSKYCISDKTMTCALGGKRRPIGRMNRLLLLKWLFETFERSRTG